MDSQDADLMSFLMNSSVGMPAAPLHVSPGTSNTPPATPRAKSFEEKEMFQTPTPVWQYRKGASVASLESATTPQPNISVSTPPSTTKKRDTALDPELDREIDEVAKKLDMELKVQGNNGEQAASAKAEVKEKGADKRKVKEEKIQKAMASNGASAPSQATGL